MLRGAGLPRPRMLWVPAGKLRRRPRTLPLLVLAAAAPAAQTAPLLWRGCLRFPADRIHKGVLELLMTGGRAELPSEREHRVATGRRDRLEGRLGFRVERGPSPADPLLLKLQWVLWARHFAETGGDPGAHAEVEITRLCDDLGYQRLANGAHRPANRRSVAEALARLAELALDLHYRAPDGRGTHLAGPVWELSLGESRVRYRPGDWARDPLWRRFNGAVGLAPAGLLALRGDRDAWAIRVGSYLSALARLNGYRPLNLGVKVLLEKTGLAAAEARNPARMREKLERALERLEEVGCLGSWTWAEEEDAEPDMDAPETLAALYRSGEHWRGRRLRITWARALEAREIVLSSARARRGGRAVPR